MNAALLAMCALVVIVLAPWIRDDLIKYPKFGTIVINVPLHTLDDDKQMSSHVIVNNGGDTGYVVLSIRTMPIPSENAARIGDIYYFGYSVTCEAHMVINGTMSTVDSDTKKLLILYLKEIGSPMSLISAISSDSGQFVSWDLREVTFDTAYSVAFIVLLAGLLRCIVPTLAELHAHQLRDGLCPDCLYPVRVSEAVYCCPECGGMWSKELLRGEWQFRRIREVRSAQ